MALSIRQSEILDIARQEGRVGVEDLAERFGVTLQTIRRDLGELSDAGKLDRVHGGAVLRAGVANIGYEERRLMNAEAKAAIGRACAAAIPEKLLALPQYRHDDRGRGARASRPPEPDGRHQ